MFFIFKNKGKQSQECSHRWEFLHSRTETEIDYNGIDCDVNNVEYVYCYCPKCKTREKVTPFEWELRHKQYLIDLNYEDEILGR